MKLSRRQLFLASLGATQLGLLDKFGMRSARAAESAYPTKLLCIYIEGGIRWETFFTPLSTKGVERLILTPDGGLTPEGYAAGQVRNYDGSAADMASTSAVRTLRGPVYWNPANPSDPTGTNPLANGKQNFSAAGYAWADPSLKVAARTSLLAGIDNGTAAHLSGHIASMCGVAGESFRAPSVQAVVAHAMAEKFPDRLLPNVTMGKNLDGVQPDPFNLPAKVSPYLVPNSTALIDGLSDKKDGAWKGLRARKDDPNLNFDGSPSTGVIPNTAIDRLLLQDARRRRGISNAQSDARLEALYSTYKGVSKSIARDVVGVVDKTVGFEHIQKLPLYANDRTFFIGGFDAAGTANSTGDYNFALRLLKSDLATSVTMHVSGIQVKDQQYGFDTHGPGAAMHTNQLRISFEGIAQLLGEMALTPTKTAGRSLLDETMVYVYSEFGRSFLNPGAHHPATCALLAGGVVDGNKMFGGYNESVELLDGKVGFPMGTALPILEEDGAMSSRPPRSQDVVSTVLAGFGLQPTKDFFIPGGFGVVQGPIKKV
jgi:hypothetical protein